MSIKDDLNRHQFRRYDAAGIGHDPYVGGDLRNSWVPSFLSRWLWRDVTNLIYAPIIEDGIGMQVRSTVGGFHSVKMTRSAWQRIVDDAITRNNGEAGPAASVSEIR